MAREEIPIPEDNHKLLEKNYFGIMSTFRYKDGLISTNPVGYVWDGDHIKVSTLKSRMKYKNLQADPRIGFCVISAKNIMDYLEIRGFATLEDDPDHSFARLQFCRGSGGQEPPEDMDPPGAERVIITIRPRQISSPTLYGGRFNNMQNHGD